MARDTQQYRLEDCDSDHPIAASVFLPFVVVRLGGVEQETEATLTVTLRRIGGEAPSQRALRLWWSPATVPTEPPAVQERVITEWAACGVACVLVALYTGLQVRQVTATGDRFDYWVGDEEHEYGLEVSGTMSDSVADVEARHREKVGQLRENPYGVDGYVVVVGFVPRLAIFSFNRFEELLQ